MLPTIDNSSPYKQIIICIDIYVTGSCLKKICRNLEWGSSSNSTLILIKILREEIKANESKHLKLKFISFPSIANQKSKIKIRAHKIGIKNFTVHSIRLPQKCSHTYSISCNILHISINTIKLQTVYTYQRSDNVLLLWWKT